MDWQTPEDSVPLSFVTEADGRALLGKPPATGAWRDGDRLGDRKFTTIGPFDPERGGHIPFVRIAWESWGTLNADKSNAILVLHALTGDSHLTGSAGNGHSTGGWWSGMIGPGKYLNTDKWFVVAPNVLGGCQGSTGPASYTVEGVEWGSRFPYLTIRDQVEAQALFSSKIGIERWACVIGGSMGGMHAIEWAITHPNRVARLAVLSAPPSTSADQLALNSVQLEAIQMDPGYHGGHYYEKKDGDGPHRGLALARRMALLNYRSPAELNKRFERSWQSDITPFGGSGKFAVESYLDFHGNKFSRRFDANSYILLVQAMNSHDVGRGRDGPASALATVSAKSLVIGIDSDRLFPVEGQRFIAQHLPHNIDGEQPIVISSDFGHDGFLIEEDVVGNQLLRLLACSD